MALGIPGQLHPGAVFKDDDGVYKMYYCRICESICSMEYWISHFS